MKFAAALSLALPFVAAQVSYEGYKAFHIDAHGDYEGLESSLEGLEYVSLSCESNHKTLDIAVSPASLEAFDALQLDATIITEDVGAHIAEEGELEPYECKIDTSYRGVR
jgi:carboxypeptidase A4